ncbi:hypothetical protein [Nocardiopsis synnemataformans]|uniref:hypothetical protein n=1 Tax=Nocardiopsis synnemataformans TaxID=61305 RepID=UPI003EBE26B7
MAPKLDYTVTDPQTGSGVFTLDEESHATWITVMQALTRSRTYNHEETKASMELVRATIRNALTPFLPPHTTLSKDGRDWQNRRLGVNGTTLALPTAAYRQALSIERAAEEEGAEPLHFPRFIMMQGPHAETPGARCVHRHRGEVLGGCLWEASASTTLQPIAEQVREHLNDRHFGAH